MDALHGRVICAIAALLLLASCSRDELAERRKEYEDLRAKPWDLSGCATADRAAVEKLLDQVRKRQFPSILISEAEYPGYMARLSDRLGLNPGVSIDAAWMLEKAFRNLVLPTLDFPADVSVLNIDVERREMIHGMETTLAKRIQLRNPRGQVFELRGVRAIVNFAGCYKIAGLNPNQ